MKVQVKRPFKSSINISNAQPIFCVLLFFGEYLNPQIRINKIENKDSVTYHPSLSELTLRIDPIIFLWTPDGFISREYLISWFFTKTCISHHCCGNASIYGVKITGKYTLWVKNEICSLSFMPPSKTLSQVVIIIPQAEVNSLLISDEQLFLKICFSPNRKGRGLWSWNLTIFVTFTFFVSVLLCHNSDSSMLKCCGNFT